jgi:hypothetical protein
VAHATAKGTLVNLEDTAEHDTGGSADNIVRRPTG